MPGRRVPGRRGGGAGVIVKARQNPSNRLPQPVVKKMPSGRPNFR